MNKINKIVCSAFICILITGLLSGCGTKVTDEYAGSGRSGKDIQDTSDTQVTEETLEVQGTSDNQGTEEALEVQDPQERITEEPKVSGPISMYSVQWECGIYYSDITYENLKAYLQKLKEEGWNDILGKEMPADITEGITGYTLVRGSGMLQIMITLSDKEASLCNSILVKEDKKLDMDKIRAREDAVTKKEALEKIQSSIDNAQENDNLPNPHKTITGVFELIIGDAYEKLGMQAFAAISDTGFYGCFLIRKGVVSYVEGDLRKACIADIDRDGKYEIIDLYTVWDCGFTKYNLVAYEYINPVYFNSLTEIPLVEYSNCFVPELEYEDLLLEKIDDNTVRLYSINNDYGNIIIDGSSLTLADMEKFPYELWSKYYDQDILIGIDKVIPSKPPQINITINGTDIGYTVKETNWDGAENDYRIADIYKEIMDKGWFIPTFKLNNLIEEEVSIPVVIDFGQSIPDSVLIYDAMLDTDGSIRYGERLILKQGFKIVDDSRIQFELKQHMSYFLSSNWGDYQRDWYRLFRIVCTWGDKECTYGILINTGNTEKLIQEED